MHYVKQRGVVFVDKYYHLLASLLVCSMNQCREAVVIISCRIGDTILPFVLLKTIAKISLQLFFLHVLARCHAYS